LNLGCAVGANGNFKPWCPQPLSSGHSSELGRAANSSHFSSRQNRCHKRRYGSCCNGSVVNINFEALGLWTAALAARECLGLAPTSHLDESFDSLLFEAVK